MSNRLKIGIVNDGGAARRAQIDSEDLIELYDGKQIFSAADLQNAIGLAVNEVVDLVVFRKNRRVALKVVRGPLGITMSDTEFDDSGITNETWTSQNISTDQAKLNHDIEAIIASTAPSIEGYRISKQLGVISAECVFGMNIFKDFLAAMSDFFGGRSGTTQNALRDARKTCIAELKREAHSVGANAIIGVDLDYSEFSGQGKSMLFLVATGTAVFIEIVANK